MWVLGMVLHVHVYIQYVVDDLVQYDKLEFLILQSIVSQTRSWSMSITVLVLTFQIILW